MKNIVNKIKRIIIVCLLPATMLAGCNLFGLDVQESFEYDYDAGIRSNELNCTVWEFLEARRSDFRIFMEGIEYVGLEHMYNESNATYIVLRNNAFTNVNASDAASNPGPGFFPKYPLINQNGETYIPTSLMDYPKETVRQLLLYHIAKGAWSWPNLPAAPTWYPTYAAGETAYMNLYLSKTSPPNIRFNDFPGHFLTGITARTTNLKASSGAYVHVLEYKCLAQPSLDDLK